MTDTNNTNNPPFEPIGGYPPIIRLSDDIDEQQLEVRSFSNPNFVDIKNIISTKKKDVFLKFGVNEEGLDQMYDSLVTTPHDYETIDFDD